MGNEKGYSLMIHGGAGTLDEIRDDRVAARYMDAVRAVLEQGREILSAGGLAIQAVEACASLLEDDPVFNAGRGSVLDELGEVRMDAAIMDGHDLAAGAVAGIGQIANPVQLARRVMRESGHVMLIGEGALRFAERCGVPTAPEGYFHTPQRIAELAAARRAGRTLLDHDAGEDHELGTIGAVARDLAGNLAAATSTGGMTNKPAGRVGDTPVVGAGVYADNETCAVSTTGVGEHFMRTVFAKTVADYIAFEGMDATAATAAGIAYLTRRVQGRGGAIVIDRHGNCASGFTTPRMIHGWIEHGGETVARF